MVIVSDAAPLVEKLADYAASGTGNANFFRLAGFYASTLHSTYAKEGTTVQCSVQGQQCCSMAIKTYADQLPYCCTDLLLCTVLVQNTASTPPAPLGHWLPVPLPVPPCRHYPS